jgi:hypothetical protein
MTPEILSQAFNLVFDPQVLWVVAGSALFGLFVGAIPGLTATMATALLVPATFFMAPIPAIAAMVTATAMAIFAGDITELPAAHARYPGIGGLHRRGLCADQARDRANCHWAPAWCFPSSVGCSAPSSSSVRRRPRRVCTALQLIRVFLAGHAPGPFLRRVHRLVGDKLKGVIIAARWACWWRRSASTIRPGIRVSLSVCPRLMGGAEHDPDHDRHVRGIRGNAVVDHQVAGPAGDRPDRDRQRASGACGRLAEKVPAADPARQRAGHGWSAPCPVPVPTSPRGCPTR